VHPDIFGLSEDARSLPAPAFLSGFAWIGRRYLDSGLVKFESRHAGNHLHCRTIELGLATLNRAMREMIRSGVALICGGVEVIRVGAK
jgi:hypothetical protein